MSNVLSEFWLELFTTIYMPIYNFLGYNGILSFILVVFFVAFQIWVFYHLFFKIFLYVLKFLTTMIVKNLLWREVEIDER